MNVTVLFFAAHRDLVGASDASIDLPDGATVSTLLATLRAQGGDWERLPESASVAVNRKYADGETVLQDGDEVALIPPVAGG